MNTKQIVDSDLEVYISKPRCFRQDARPEYSSVTVFAMKLYRFTETENDLTTSIRKNRINMVICITAAISHRSSIQ
jgi:hypothetical protein